MDSNLFFVLGAPDHEMREIQRVCLEKKFKFAYATVPQNQIVRACQAYSATNTLRLVPLGSTIVQVECNVLGLNADIVIDHHNPGDPGYGKKPDEYLEGSSLGQFLALIGETPTQRQRVIAAADHCLTAAYQGRCPGVTPEELKAFREESRSQARGLTIGQLSEQIAQASEALKAAPTISMAGHQVAWFDEPPPEVAEASARLAFPYAFISKEVDGRMKSGIRSAPAEVVEAFIQNCGLDSIYGDPQRGFAGGYFPQ